MKRRRDGRKGKGIAPASHNSLRPPLSLPVFEGGKIRKTFVIARRRAVAGYTVFHLAADSLRQFGGWTGGGTGGGLRVAG